MPPSLSPQLAILEAQINNAELRAQHAQSDKEVLGATLAAAELCMQTLGLATENTDIQNLKARCRFLLDHADRLKNGSKSPSWPGLDGETFTRTESTTKQPTTSRSFTTREKIILLEGSKLHGAIFPPWTSPPAPSEFQLTDGESLFTDNADFQLSDAQLEIFGGWVRPDQLSCPSGSKRDDTGLSCTPSMTTDKPVDLVQDVTTDCSVVASLCAATARAKHGHCELTSSIMYPYDVGAMCPIVSRSGKYVFKLYFNGCHRRVTIDDRLPSSRTARSLYAVDRSNPCLLWPALIEKAYLKVRGGYDFPGSNSGTDIWILTGWIPEQLFLQSDEISRDALWSRVFKAFQSGHALVTLGTGKLTESEEEGMGLVGEHDYAVVSMKEVDQQRLLLIKNPWSEGTIWKGGSDYRLQCQDTDSTRPMTDEAVRVKTAERLLPGTFWMDLNDVFQSFESMYINWNPALFSYREDTHFSWHLDKSGRPAGLFVSNPQYKVCCKTGGCVWLLLSRHLRSRNLRPKREDGRSSQREYEERGFISLYAFANGGERVVRSDGALLRGPYVDSPNALIRLNMAPNDSFTIVISEQDLARSKFNFTLSAFSSVPVRIQEAQERYLHIAHQRGAWTHLNAGGNAGNALYYTNPQFSIQLQETSDISLLLELETGDFPVHLKIVRSQGRETSSFHTRDIVGDSGEYNNGYAFAEMRNVVAGKYIVICSTFDCGQLGSFSLRVAATSICSVNQVQRPEAGRLVSFLGPAAFTHGNDRLLAPLVLSRVTRLSMTAKPFQNSNSIATGSGSRSPIKISLEYGQGPTKQVLSVSGLDEFLDAQFGVKTRDVDLLPRMCEERGLWITLSRLGRPGMQQGDESIEVEVLTDAPVGIGKWEVGTA